MCSSQETQVACGIMKKNNRIILSGIPLGQILIETFRESHWEREMKVIQKYTQVCLRRVIKIRI